VGAQSRPGSLPQYPRPVIDEEITPPAGSLRVRETAHGRGVFAARDIGAGEAIEICPIVELGEYETTGPLGDYVVTSHHDPNETILMLGYGSLYNHSSDANAETIQHGDDAFLFNAVRDIAEGEEITIDYGNEWWEERELEPG
jgi:SET domain-containing protein